MKSPRVSLDERSRMLSVRDLEVSFRVGDAWEQAVSGVSFDVGAGEVLAIVGESGSGKSATALGLLGVHPPGSVRVSGESILAGTDMLTLGRRGLRRVLGRDVGLILQDPSTALNPVLRVEAQLVEAVGAHEQISRQDAWAKAIGAMSAAGVPNPEMRMRQYPHELSGGLRQRVVIAGAIINEPKLLIADEPTTALDVTIQAQVMASLLEAREKVAASMILITHDLALVAQVATRVCVMYAGRIVEQAGVAKIFDSPTHPYTQALLECLPETAGATNKLKVIGGQPPGLGAMPDGCRFQPRCDLGRHLPTCSVDDPTLRPSQHDAEHLAACHFANDSLAMWHDSHDVPLQPTGATLAVEETSSASLLVAQDLSKTYVLKRSLKHWFSRTEAPRIRAVDGVDLAVGRGETLAVVGESGSGKTTLAKLLLGIAPADHGTVRFEDQILDPVVSRRSRSLRREIQILFQDPYSSLNPRMMVGESIAEPLRLHGLYEEEGGEGRIDELLGLVGFSGDAARKYPHQFSGGQRQRIALARSLATRPKLLILDEPVSALDVSVQAQVLNLLEELQTELGMSYILISHDLSVVRHTADRIAIMYLGNIVETGRTVDVMDSPQHPYTMALLSAVPIPDPTRAGFRGRILLSGDIPTSGAVATGCPFRSRCWRAQDQCGLKPELNEVEPGHRVACYFPGPNADEGASSNGQPLEDP